MNLTQELLKQILAGNGGDYFLQRGNQYDVSESGQTARNPDYIYRGKGRNRWDTWDTEGNYLGEGTADSDLSNLAKLAAVMGGTYLAGTGLAGMGGEAGASLGGEGSMLSGGQVNALGTGGAAGTALGAATEPVSSLVTGGVTGGGSKNALSGLLSPGVAQLLGGAVGALTSQDKTATSTREPWEPAQGLLKNLIGRAEGMANQYLDNPFSDAQKTAYGNLTGLLDTINQQAPGLMAGFNANASGANNYDRSNPRKQLTGSSFDMSQFLPGLLNLFPPKRTG